MIIWADGTVTGLRGQWRGAVELTVARRDTGAASSEVPALAYTDLMAVPAVGDRVLLNVAAIFCPIFPDLPIPTTTTFERRLIVSMIRVTAVSKPSSS